MIYEIHCMARDILWELLIRLHLCGEGYRLFTGPIHLSTLDSSEIMRLLIPHESDMTRGSQQQAQRSAALVLAGAARR